MVITEKIIFNLFNNLKYFSSIKLIKKFSSNLKIFEHIINVII